METIRGNFQPTQVMKIVAEGKRPVVIADGADRIGDSTHILRELIQQSARNWAVPGINDPEAAKHLEQTAKVGDIVAKVNFPVDSPGYLEIPNLRLLDYKNLPDDIYPLGKKWQK